MHTQSVPQPKDATVIARISAAEREQLQAIADANDEPLSQVVRRAIRAFLAASAVVVVALGLGACGGADQPANPGIAATTAADDGVVTVEEARKVIEEATATPDTTSGVTCFSFSKGPSYDTWLAWVDRMNARPGIDQVGAQAALAAYEDLLDDLSAGPFCTDEDRGIANNTRAQLLEEIAAAQAKLDGN
jgi:hypothetical protein